MFRSQSARIPPNVHTIQRKARRNKHHQQLKSRCGTKDDDGPVSGGFLNRAILPAGFTKISKLGFFAFLCYSIGCRSPPLVLHFSDSKKNLEMEDKLMEQHNKYTLVVNKNRVTVTKEVYKAYYRCRDREKYLDKLAEENNISLEGCAEKGISVEYIISSAEDSMEDTIILKHMIARMLHCVKMLNEPERTLITELYLRGKSERQLSKEIGVPPMTIHDRKSRILKKLKKMMEK